MINILPAKIKPILLATANTPSTLLTIHCPCHARLLSPSFWILHHGESFRSQGRMVFSLHPLPLSCAHVVYTLLDARLFALQMTVKRSIHFVFCSCRAPAQQAQVLHSFIGSTFVRYNQFINTTSVPSRTSEKYGCSFHTTRVQVMRKLISHCRCQ